MSPVVGAAVAGAAAVGPDQFVAADGAGWDRFDVRRARHAPGRLRSFNDAGVLVAADIHVAGRLAGLGDEQDETVVLAAALAVRAPRLGHVCVDLAAIRGSVIIDADRPVDLQALPWPEPGEWIERVSASALVAVEPHRVAGRLGDRPLRLADSLLYLDRYWREERQVAVDLATRSDEPAADVDMGRLAEGLARLFPGDQPDDQRLAAAAAVLRRFSVIAGGPGTGKTTTVARILALLDEQATAAGAPPPLVALAAPTGKAAARLEEAVHGAAVGLDVSGATRTRLLAMGASTLHRLLGWRPDSHNRFRHNGGNRLPHDVVIVDETSMVSLTLMARLVEAVRSGARLVLVGDPEQLASVEAGAVLGDIVGPAADRLLMRPEAVGRLAQAVGRPITTAAPPPATTVGDGIVVLHQVHRFGGAIAALAQAVRRGDANGAVAVLSQGSDDVRWIGSDLDASRAGWALHPIREAMVAAGRRLSDAARMGDGAAAIEALSAFRVLCAHRRGPQGVETWMSRVESWLAAEIDGFAAEGAWYAGRPLLVTENDYGLRLFNGDTGVVIAKGPGRMVAVFERRGGLLELSPSRLAAVDTVYAMTVHKSQGSQFDGVAVILPDPASPILTRELLYTAVTRARRQLILAGSEEAVRTAVTRPIARASGLRGALWAGRAGPAGPDRRGAGTAT